jgi:alkylation response protein AidB-like acyl-CoA dehydrogenase
MIQEKIAEMAQRIYVSESMLYRTAGLIDDMMKRLDITGPDGGRVIAKGIEEYAIECSLNKVFTTEVLAFVVDEGVQIHGGYGFIAEYPIERLYRDARIFRIFEGTNEINRTLIPALLMRKEGKDASLLHDAIAGIKKSIDSGLPDRVDTRDLVQAAKDVFFFSLGAALEKYGDALLKEQEILGRLADIAINTFAMESAWLRAKKSESTEGEKAAARKMKMATAFSYSSIEKISVWSAQVLSAVATGEALKRLRGGLAELTKYIPIDGIALNREIATEISAAGKYII